MIRNFDVINLVLYIRASTQMDTYQKQVARFILLKLRYCQIFETNVYVRSRRAIDRA